MTDLGTHHIVTFSDLQRFLDNINKVDNYISDMLSSTFVVAKLWHRHTCGNIHLY